MIGLALIAVVGAGVAIRATVIANQLEVLASVAKQKADDASRHAEEVKVSAEKAIAVAEQASAAEWRAKEAQIATINAKEQERLAIARLEEKTEQAKEDSKLLFAYGVAEYKADWPQSGVDILLRARALRADHDPLKQSYEPVLVDRLTRGNRSWASMHHQDLINHIAFSPDRQPNSNCFK